MVVKIASSDAEIEKCYPVMAELRPHIAEDGFLDLVREMEVDGYRLAYLEDAGAVSAVAGYRIYRNLFLGKHLYVDDLVTSNQQRSRGHGAQLLGYLRDLAIAEDCAYLHLDSGTQRHDAHRFYFREGMSIACYHFIENLTAG